MKERVCECPKGARYHDSRLCGCGDRVSLRNTRVSPLIPSTKEKSCMWYRYGIFYLRNNKQVSTCLYMCLRVNSLSITNCSLPSSLGLDSNTSPARCIRSCTLVHHKIRTKRKRNKREKNSGISLSLAHLSLSGW